MQSIAPLGGVYQGGTLSGNPLATAAGLAMLDQLTDAAYAQLEATATRLATGLETVFADAGIPVIVPRVGSLLGIFFTDTAPTNFDEASAAADNGIYTTFFHGMLERGIALAPGPYEAIFVSTVHTDEVIDATIAAAGEVAASMA